MNWPQAPTGKGGAWNCQISIPKHLNMSQHVSKHAQHSTLPRVLCKGKFQTAHILRHQALLPLLSLHFDQHASFRSQASCKAGKELLQPSLAKKSCSHNFYIILHNQLESLAALEDLGEEQKNFPIRTQEFRTEN